MAGSTAAGQRQSWIVDIYLSRQLVGNIAIESWRHAAFVMMVETPANVSRKPRVRESWVGVGWGLLTTHSIQIYSLILMYCAGLLSISNEPCPGPAQHYLKFWIFEPGCLLLVSYRRRLCPAQAQCWSLSPLTCPVTADTAGYFMTAAAQTHTCRM